jgi:hypothetical protein
MGAQVVRTSRIFDRNESADSSHCKQPPFSSRSQLSCNERESTSFMNQQGGYSNHVASFQASSDVIPPPPVEAYICNDIFTGVLILPIFHTSPHLSLAKKVIPLCFCQFLIAADLRKKYGAFINSFHWTVPFLGARRASVSWASLNTHSTHQLGRKRGVPLVSPFQLFLERLWERTYFCPIDRLAALSHQRGRYGSRCIWGLLFNWERGKRNAGETQPPIKQKPEQPPNKQKPGQKPEQPPKRKGNRKPQEPQEPKTKGEGSPYPPPYKER